MGTLFLQVIREPDAYPFTACDGDVQILVKSLWSAESSRIDGAEAQITERTVADVHPRREHWLGNKAVLVHANSGEEAPAGVLPLILEIGAENAYLLRGFVVIAKGDIVQVIIVIFQTGGQLRRHEQQTVKLVGILTAEDRGEVGGLSVRIRILPCSVITAPSDVLGGSIRVPNLPAILTLPVIAQRSAVVRVFRLLRDKRFMSRKIQTISPSPELLGSMILQPDFGESIHAEVSSCTYCDGIDHRNVREPVTVRVIAIPQTFLPEHEQAPSSVIRHH